jgi:hypothetical protein
VTLRYLRALPIAAFLLAGVESSAEVIEYRVVGAFVKDPSSEPLFESKLHTVQFEIRFAADKAVATRVRAGSRTSLPNFPEVTIHEGGFRLPASALKAFSFNAPGSSARYMLEDVIADEVTGASVFMTGSPTQPTGINMLLANSLSGYVQIGIPDCERQCRLVDGYVIDRAGPFGVVVITAIGARLPTSPGRM